MQSFLLRSLFGLLSTFVFYQESAAEAGDGAKPKVMLIFSVEQGFVNSPVESRDSEGLRRVAAVLNDLQGRYDVYVTLGCAQTDETKLTDALDLFAAARIPFLLDTWASDTMAPPRPPNRPVTTPFDRSHGLCMSMARLVEIRAKYGDEFAGLRMHEVFALNLAIEMFRMGKWSPKNTDLYPEDHYFKKSILDQQFTFASSNKMFVVFSDPFWLASGNHSLRDPAVEQRRNEDDLATAMKDAPNVGIVLYANNEPLKKPNWPDPLHARMNDWSALFPANVLSNAARFGLSDQAWICDRVQTPENQCDPNVLAAWASAAVRLGATVFEFEPYWYFFKFPRDAGINNNYADYPNYEQRGEKTSNFETVIQALDGALAEHVRGAHP